MGSFFSQSQAQQNWRAQNYSYHTFKQKSELEEDSKDAIQMYQDSLDSLKDTIITTKEQQSKMQKLFQNREIIQKKQLKQIEKVSKYIKKNEQRIKDYDKKLKELKSITKSQASNQEQFSQRKKVISKTKSSNKSKMKTPVKSAKRKSSFESIIKTRRQMQQEQNSINKKLFKDNQFSQN